MCFSVFIGLVLLGSSFFDTCGCGSGALLPEVHFLCSCPGTAPQKFQGCILFLIWAWLSGLFVEESSSSVKDDLADAVDITQAVVHQEGIDQVCGLV